MPQRPPPRPLWQRSRVRILPNTPASRPPASTASTSSAAPRSSTSGAPCEGGEATSLALSNLPVSVPVPVPEKDVPHRNCATDAKDGHERVESRDPIPRILDPLLARAMHHRHPDQDRDAAGNRTDHHRLIEHGPRQGERHEGLHVQVDAAARRTDCGDRAEPEQEGDAAAEHARNAIATTLARPGGATTSRPSTAAAAHSTTAATAIGAAVMGRLPQRCRGRTATSV